MHNLANNDAAGLPAERARRSERHSRLRRAVVVGDVEGSALGPPITITQTVVLNPSTTTTLAASTKPPPVTVTATVVAPPASPTSSTSSPSSPISPSSPSSASPPSSPATTAFPSVSASRSAPAPSNSAVAGTGADATRKTPAAAIAVPVVLAFLLLGVLGFLIVRRRNVRIRERKRNTWNVATFPTSREKMPSPAPQQMFPSAPTPPPSVPMSMPSPKEMTVITPPTTSFGNLPLPPRMSVMSSGQMGGGGARTAMVRCTFIPSLPDELSITTGEIVVVLVEYDDGWCLCENARVEQGMVPLECLDSGTGNWRGVKRESSLIGSTISSAGRSYSGAVPGRF